MTPTPAEKAAREILYFAGFTDDDIPGSYAYKAALQLAFRLISEAMPKWQPIETAPKDGTKIIGRDDRGRVSDTWWGDTSDIHHVIFGKFKQSEWWRKDIGDEWFDPVEFIPMPQPPEDATR